MQMKVDKSHAMNRQVLQYVGRNAMDDTPLLASPKSVQEAYYGQGSHPDIVERVWDQLGGSLPRDCRCLVFGTPALVHPSCGIIFAFCNGTQYNLRLTPKGIDEAVKLGVKTVTRWSSGEEMNARDVLGTDWVFGMWSNEEPRWCQDMFESLSGLAPEETG